MITWKGCGGASKVSFTPLVPYLPHIRLPHIHRIFRVYLPFISQVSFTPLVPYLPHIHRISRVYLPFISQVSFTPLVPPAALKAVRAKTLEPTPNPNPNLKLYP